MTASPVSVRRHGAVKFIIVDNPPVNALSAAVRQGLQRAIHNLQEDPTCMAAVLCCDGRGFMAGADIREFGHPPEPPYLGAVCDCIERSSKPVVAAMHGTALGGGVEIALACHARIASPATKLGLPETKLGLIPGAGGTQRLPRLVGMQQAYEMIVSARPRTAEGACGIGLVDEVVTSGLRETAAAHASQLARRGHWRRTGALFVDPASVPLGGMDALAVDAASRSKGVLAIERAVEALTASLGPLEEGLAVERRLFLELLEHPQSRALRYLFFAERAASRNSGSPPTQGPVAILGAGTMGVGIAISVLSAGLCAVLIDKDAQALARAAADLDAHFSDARHSAAAPGGAHGWRAQLTASTSFAAATGSSLAIEAITENFSAKREVFRELDALLPPDAILATNTSYLDVDRLATETSRAQRVIGLHFFAPAQVMRLVEVVRASASTDEAVEAGVAFVRQLGKQPVIVGNAPGFVGNAMLQSYGRENQFLLLEGALPWQVDTALERWGMAMGPNAVLDLTGIDVGYRARRERSDLPPDATYFRVADALVEAGRLGRKTGAGNYRYVTGRRRGEPDPRVEEIIRSESARLGITRRDVTDKEIVSRCIMALVHTGASLLERGVAASASDIDLVWTLGYGFPRWRGGPMYYADTLGAATILDEMRILATRHGAQWWDPPPLLCRLAEAGGTFTEGG